MRKVLQQLGKYKKDTFLCIGLTSLEVIFEILMPFVTAIIIDQGLEPGDLGVVYRYGALMVVMALSKRGDLRQYPDIFLFQH